ncbi:hypothetical protein H4582DRAFT_1235510 [Lactarius indigo]|nr:hypothetical protein H4582DRAFT_1235510 [Lactarius indigo]
MLVSAAIMWGVYLCNCDRAPFQTYSKPRLYDGRPLKILALCYPWQLLTAWAETPGRHLWVSYLGTLVLSLDDSTIPSAMAS